MKQRQFFILLFVGGAGISVFYFFDFLKQHPTLEGALHGSSLLFIGLAIVLQLCAHLVRADKSRFLLNKIRPAKASVLFRGLSVGFLFNTLLPLRIGEFIRAIYIGEALSISKTTVFVSIIIERIVDGFILGFLLLIAGFIVENQYHLAFVITWQIGWTLILVSAMLSVVINTLRNEHRWLLKTVHGATSVFNPKISDRLRFMSWSAIYGTKLMLSDRRSLLRYIRASIVMWILYISSTVFAVLAFFESLSPAKTWYAVQSIYAAVGTPLGPGYPGTLHIVLLKLFSRVELLATSGFSLMVWSVMVVPISIIALLVLIRQRFDEERDIPAQEMLIHKLYREKDISRELSHFLDAYLKGERINQILTQAELDGKFRLIKSFKGGSNAHTMLAWQHEQLYVKKLTLIQYADKLEEQAKWLLEREHLEHIPKVVRQDKTAHYYSFDIEYKEAYYPFFDFIHSNTTTMSSRVLNKILRFMNTHIYREKPVSNKVARKNLNDYIANKVIGKVNDAAAMSPDLSTLMAHPTLTVNGMKYDNILQVVEKIKNHKAAMNDLISYRESPIHGDLTIDNLIVSSEADYLVIDPNNENQVSSRIVDFAKMYQSLHSGYEFLIQLEKCEVKENQINFEDAMSHKYAEIFQAFDQNLRRELSEAEYRSILFHEAVHYCRMLTYRININPATVAVFYGTAVRLFNEFLAQYTNTLNASKNS